MHCYICTEKEKKPAFPGKGTKREWNGVVNIVKSCLHLPFIISTRLVLPSLDKLDRK